MNGRDREPSPGAIIALAALALGGLSLMARGAWELSSRAAAWLISM